MRSSHGPTGYPPLRPSIGQARETLCTIGRFANSICVNCKRGLRFSGFRRWAAAKPMFRPRLRRFARRSPPCWAERGSRLHRRRCPLSRDQKSCDSTRWSCWGPAPPIAWHASWSRCRRRPQTDPDLVRGFVQRGMNIARINCAHDDAPAWRAMAHHVREAAACAGTTCRVAMDLAGPKLRTGPLEPGPRVVKLRPQRDALGQVVAPARAWLTSTEEPTDPPEPDMVLVTVPRHWLTDRAAGDVLILQDARGSKRELVLEAVADTVGRIRDDRAKNNLLANRNGAACRRQPGIDRSRRAAPRRSRVWCCTLATFCS